MCRVSFCVFRPAFCLTSIMFSYVPISVLSSASVAVGMLHKGALLSAGAKVLSYRAC